VRRFAVAAWAAFLLGACSLVEHFDAPKIAKLDEPTVRAFASNQQAAWIAHDFDRFYASCAADAVFVSVRWNADGSITRQRRTPAEDRAAAEKYFKSHPGKFTEVAAIDRIEIAPDGLSARIISRETARIADAKPGVLRATTEQTVVLRNGRLMSLGQTDTAVR